MKYKKSMILLVLIILIFGVASVCASENNSTIELSQAGTDEMIFLEEDKLIGQTENIEPISEGNSGTFTELQTYIKTATQGSTLTLNKSYEYEDGFDTEGILIDKSITINGNGFKIDAQGISRIFRITADNVMLENIIFTKGKTTDHGGAVYFQKSGTVTNCNFTNNSASSRGGAVYFSGTGNVTNCNFTNNSATDYGGAIRMFSGSVENCNFTNNTVYVDGGAVYFLNEGTVKNCNFTGNNATNGSAIYFYGISYSKSVSNSRFLNNRANSEALEVTKNDNNITITFTGNNNLLNAIYSRNDAEVTFTNVTYWGAKGIANTGSSTTTPSRSNKETGQNITVGVVVNDNLVLSEVITTDEGGMIVLPIIAGDNYYITARHDADSYYTEAEKTISNNTQFNVNVTPQTTHNKTVNITAKSNILIEVMDGNLLFIFQNGDKRNASYASNGTWWTLYEFTDYGDYQVNATYNGNLNNVTVNNATITISKTPTNITIENETVELFVSDSIGTGAALTPAYAGNLTFTSSNVTVAKVEDDKIIAVSEGSAVITVSFAGRDDYAAAENKTITVTVTLNDASVSVNNSTLNLFVDDTFTIIPTTEPKGLTVIFIPDDSGVYSIDKNGVVTALKEGKGSILVKVGGDGVYTKNSTIVNVTVSKVPTEISVNQASLELLVDDETIIVATLAPADAGNVTFTSSNDSLVSVDAQGNVIAWEKGQVIITVSFAGDNKYAAAENKTVTVDVGLNDASVTVDNDTLDLKVGETYAINATKHPNSILLDIDFNSSDDSVASVDEKGIVTAVGEGTAIITIEVGDDERYAKNSTTVTVTVNKLDTNVNVSMPENITVGENSTVNVELPEDATGNVVAKVDGKVVDNTSVVDGKADLIIPSLNAGNHTIEIVYSGDDKYKTSSKNTTVTVNKASTKLSAADVTATYKVNKYFVITLNDSKGNPLADANVTVDLNGAKDYTTDKNGLVKIKVSTMVPKTYTAKITFAGDENYTGSSASAKVVVKKATPKITASNKMFKTTTKTKKYTITLKDNAGKVIKNAKVTMKVNGKTYKATTNSKGKATFKITKLAKKGTFKAVITYKGSKYYNKVTKKVNIKVISTWKTISKGSKLKSTVKEIQRALKNNGYYLTAYGHYLKVDGIYGDYTVKAVKQFQKAKGLKVTGKVDEKTAKKLGII